LYNIEEDFSQADDLASVEPTKLKELQDLFLVEAKKYGVLPLDPRLAERMNPKLRVAGEPPTRWTYFGNQVWLPEPIGPQLFPRPFTITADIEVPESGAEGVITCAGAFSAGWSLYLDDGYPVFRYTCFEIADKTIKGAKRLPSGKSLIEVEFTPDGSAMGAGTLAILVDGETAAEGKLERTLFRHGLEPFEIGRDSITPVDPAYQNKGDFEFNGLIDKVDFKLAQ
jgi:arylsulfatase